jgi:hypothetical protein
VCCKVNPNAPGPVLPWWQALKIPKNPFVSLIILSQNPAAQRGLFGSGRIRRPGHGKMPGGIRMTPDGLAGTWVEKTDR